VFNRRVALQSIAIAALLGLIGIGIYYYAIRFRPRGKWAERCDTPEISSCNPPLSCVLVHAGHGTPDHHYCCTKTVDIGPDPDNPGHFLTGCAP
jgi:hypothetical protein